MCWVAVGLAVAGLAAIELLPNWVYSRQSVRSSGLTLDHIRPMCLQPLSLFQLLDPFVAGGPADYRGPGEFYWEAVCYFGVVPLVFAVVGVCRAIAAIRRSASACFGGGAAVRFWRSDPLVSAAVPPLPGVSLFRARRGAVLLFLFHSRVGRSGLRFTPGIGRGGESPLRRLTLMAAGLALSAVPACGCGSTAGAAMRSPGRCPAKPLRGRWLCAC